MKQSPITVLIIVIGIIFSLFNRVHGQVVVPDTLFKGDTLTLANVSSTLSSSEIIVYLDNPDYIVYSSQESFIGNLKQFISAHDVEWDKKLLKQFEQIQEDTIYIETSQSLKNLEHRLKYRWADLIEGQQCLIYNKNEQSYEECIWIERFIKNNAAGKNYILFNGDQILSIYTGVF